jgi:sarcosine oxidase subunit gamma
VADLAPRGAFAGLALPHAAGDARLAALPETPRTAVAPFAGQEGAVAATLAAALPPPGASGGWPGGRILWAGAGLWLVEGDAPDLAALALATDASDAWAGLLLEGRDAREVLARLVPLDLDPAAFPAGSVARSLLRQVPLLLVARGEGFELLVPRSFAGTATGELVAAMDAVAARAALPLTPPRAPL